MLVKIKYVDKTNSEVIEELDSDAVDIQQYCKDLKHNLIQQSNEESDTIIWMEINNEFIKIGV